MTVDTNILNPVGSIELDIFEWKVPDDLPLQEFKYSDPKLVLRSIPQCTKELVLEMMDVVGLYDDRSIVIDYKVRDLKSGDFGSGLYGYHLDCTNNIHDDFEPETHIIYSTVIGTKIITNPINVQGYKSVEDVLRNEVVVEQSAKVNAIHKYTSKVLHSCPIMPVDSQRLLIRVTSGFRERIQYAKKH